MDTLSLPAEWHVRNVVQVGGFRHADNTRHVGALL